MATSGINVVIIPAVLARRERYVRRAQALRRRHEESGGVEAEEGMPKRVQMADLRLHEGARAILPLFVGRSTTGEPAIHGISIPVSNNGEMPQDMLQIMRTFMMTMQRAFRLEQGVKRLIRTVRLSEGTQGRIVTVFMPGNITEALRPTSPPAPPPGLQEAIPVWEDTFSGLNGLNDLTQKLSRVLHLPESIIRDDEDDDEEEEIPSAEENESSQESDESSEEGIGEEAAEDSAGDEERGAKAGEEGEEEEEETADVQLDPAVMAEVQRIAKEGREEPVVLQIPHPAVFLVHAFSVLAAAPLGAWALLYLPLGLRYPWLLPLVPHGILVRLIFPHLFGLEPIWIGLITIALAGSWIFCVSTAYRAARYQLSFWRGAMAVLGALGSLLSFLRPRPAASAGGGATSTGGAAAEVRFSVPRPSDATQAVDVLVFLAACLHHIPPVSFLAPGLLSAAIATEAKGSSAWSVPNILGLILFHLAKDPTQRLASMALAALGAPGFWMVPASEFGAAWGEIRERAKGFLLTLRNRNLREWWLALRMGASPGPVRLPRLRPIPTDAAAQELLPILAEMERILGIRESLARYEEDLRAAMRHPDSSKAIKLRIPQELAIVQRLREAPALLLPEIKHHGVYYTLLGVTAQPSLLSFRIQPSTLVPSRRHWVRDEEEGEETETLGSVLRNPDSVGMLFRRVEERMRREGGGRIGVEFDAERGLFRISHVRPVTEEWKKKISQEALQDPPRHQVLSPLSVFVPFAYSAIRAGEKEKVEFGIVATPKASAHMAIAAPTRGGKSNMLAFWTLQMLRADADPSLPFRVGVMLIDGKGETVANFAFAADRMLLPPFQHRPDAPGRTLYTYAALYMAVQLRNAFSAQVRKAVSLLEAAGVPVPEEIRQAIADPNAFSVLAGLFPEAALYLTVFIDEFWAIQESMGSMQAIQVEANGQKIRLRAPEVTSSALNYLIIAAASAGFAVVPTTQSTRRDALNNPALRDNASVAIGSGIQPALVHPILSETMKAAMGAITAQYHRGGSGGSGIPLYTFMPLLRAAGYARRDGSRILAGGNTVGSGEFQEIYAGDIIYAPYSPPEEAKRLLPQFRPFRLRQESVRALENMARELARRDLLNGLPLMARIAEASERERTEEEIVSMLREMLSWIDSSVPEERRLEELIRLGQEGVVRIAQATQEQLSTAKAQEED